MRKVNSPPPDDISGKNSGDAGRLQWMQQVTPAVTELLRMMGTSVSAAEVDAAMASAKEQATADAMSAIPSAASIASTATASANTVVTRRVASATNTAAVTVPGAGTVDAPLTLTPTLKDATYTPASPVLATNNVTLLGNVLVVGVVARTADTLTVRLRNTGLTALTVPIGAITAVAIHPATV